MRTVRESLKAAYATNVEGCVESIVALLPRDRGGVLLDCGCNDGSVTARFADRVAATDVLGIEIREASAELARSRGIDVIGQDLNRPLPVTDGSVDIVTANQVIEHLHDTDAFAREVHRVLRPGGTLILSTNNLSSWHNIVALILGAQPFPADVSGDSSIGKLIPLFEGDAGSFSSWTHLRVFSFKALTEFLERHGFTVERTVGVGYYPLPTRIARFMATTDPRHSAYLTVRARKPDRSNQIAP